MAEHPLVVRYEKQPCPHCGAVLDASIGFEDDIEPREGDVSVCAACKGFLVWEAVLEPEKVDTNFVQRKLGTREFNDLPGDVRADLLKMRAKLEQLERDARKPS
jgi:hypothetical protein